MIAYRRRLLVAIILASLLPWGTLGINVLETASPIGSQHLKLTFDLGLTTSESGGATSWHFAPQLRLALGIADGIDLALQGGAISTLGANDARFLGAILDAKFMLTDVPGMYAMAWGAGGGYGLSFLGEDWGVFAQFLFESHARLFPIYFVYRGILPIDGGGIRFEPYVAVGVDLSLSSTAQLLLGVDVYQGAVSVGLGLAIAF